ncbi:MAG: DUF4838 domain-containing protein [Bacteroidota bacterium]
MAQANIVINEKSKIIAASEKTKPAAKVLKNYLDQALKNTILIEVKELKKKSASNIHLEIASVKEPLTAGNFIIRSDAKNIYLIAFSEKELHYAVVTLLEIWGFRKFTSKSNYIPFQKDFIYPKNTKKTHEPSFEYRALLYPDCYDEEFRKWHKLDWHTDDFGIWGHSFGTLLPPKQYFKSNPDYFALYEESRRDESLCMTNDSVVNLVASKMQEVISKTPNAKFYSVSQNDDVIYCECKKCSEVNAKHGGPQGGLYYFLNRLAARFPNNKIVTLAYLHTFKPPIELKIEPNIYTLLCPIELNRGKAIATNSPLEETIKSWNTTNPNLYLWDYTVQFSNYLSPFPNIHTFSDNYKFFKKNKIKGLFVQGYADVPGDFSELRQYLLAKLVWDSDIDIEATTDDFLRGFYGKAAPALKKYLNLLAENQQTADRYLDIYSGPVQSRNTFLSPEAMTQYDALLQEAAQAVSNDPEIASRINKLRLALEFVYFEQSKYYGSDKHGMFNTTQNGERTIKEGLNERVRKFADLCNDSGIYELSEGGLKPNQYYEDWIAISKNTGKHLGENFVVSFLTPPSDDFKGKGTSAITDGLRGYKDFEINWVGWYGNNPEMEINTNKLDFNVLRLNFLNDPRHFIFAPQKVAIYGFKNKKWKLLSEEKLPELTEDYTFEIIKCESSNKKFSSFAKLKIVIQNQNDLPIWRKRKSKKPMVMIDEIELYKKENK